MSTNVIQPTSRIGIAMELDALTERMRDYVREMRPSLSDQLSLSLSLKMLGKDETFLRFIQWMMTKETTSGTKTNN